MAHQIKTDSPEQLSYENQLLRLEVLGGVKLEGLDRMRVTLKVELKDSPRPPVRHNLDLYNDNQLEKFIRKVAERLEIGTSVIAASLSELTGELEKYRLEMIKQQQSHQPQAKRLTETEKATAIEHLKHPKLLAQTLADLQHTGIQGEADNTMILYIAMTSRKTHDPLSVICLAKSGVGKSYLMEKVAQCFPEEDCKEHTQFSGNSFYYYRREEIRGKVFLIEDLDGAQAVLFPIRELQTKKRISKTVTMKDKNGQLRTITLIVEGPVSVIGCTTKEKVYEDNANRAILVYLDSSKAQDEQVMNYQKQHRAGLVDIHNEKMLQAKLQDMQRVLEPVKVINPYAPLIDLPKEIFKPRRTLPLLLSFIEAVSFYHQYQREQKADEHTGEIYIEVHPQDIEQSFLLLKDVLFRKSDELSGAAREFYQWLQSWNEQRLLLPSPNGEGLGVRPFFGNEIRQENRIHPRTLNRYLQELTEYGLLQITGGNRHKTGYSYRVATAGNYDALQKSIMVQVERVMKNIWEAFHEKQEAQSQILQKKTKDKKSPLRGDLEGLNKPVRNQLDSKAIDQPKPLTVAQ
jgi:DNA-binding HxlR family transcriptional regulator